MTDSRHLMRAGTPRKKSLGILTGMNRLHFDQWLLEPGAGRDHGAEDREGFVYVLEGQASVEDKDDRVNLASGDFLGIQGVVTVSNHTEAQVRLLVGGEIP